MSLQIKMIFLPVVIALVSCSKDDVPHTLQPDIDYRQEMRNFVIGLSGYAKTDHPNFLIIPQNGIELVTENGEEDGQPYQAYLNAIDGHGQEDLFYGFTDDDQATPNNENNYLKNFLNISKQAGNTILVTDYCSTSSKMEHSYTINAQNGYVSFAADHRELDNIPTLPTKINHENSNVVTKFSDVKNFLYLINPQNFSSKADFIAAVHATNYDLLIMDLFFTDGQAFTSTEVDEIKQKANGGKRLVVSYMSIGEAEDYRYYWSSDWKEKKPLWLDAENPEWLGNYKVKYWTPEWQQIIYGNDGSYLKKILDAHFDGVYLDIIEAFEYYEK